MSNSKKERISLAIKEVISELMERVMERVLITDPFIKEKHHAKNLFMLHWFLMKYLKVHILKEDL